MITDDYDKPTIAELDDANRMLTEIQGASVVETGEVPDWTYTAKYVLLEELERRTEDDGNEPWITITDDNEVIVHDEGDQ